MEAISDERATELYHLVYNAAIDAMIREKIAQEENKLNGSNPPDSDTVRDLPWVWLHAIVTKEIKDAIDYKINGNKETFITDSWAALLTSLFQAIATVSTIGAGFVFTVIFSQIQVPTGVSKTDSAKVVDSIRDNLMTAWVLFLLSMFLATLAIVVIATFQEAFTKRLRTRGSWHWRLVMVARIVVYGVMLLPVLAFIFVAEAISPYGNGDGIGAQVLLIFMWVCMIMIWALTFLRKRGDRVKGNACEGSNPAGSDHDGNDRRSNSSPVPSGLGDGVRSEQRPTGEEPV